MDTNKDDAEIEKKLVRCDEGQFRHSFFFTPIDLMSCQDITVVAQHNVQQSRKRAASTMGKNERSDEEEESDKEEIPASESEFSKVRSNLKSETRRTGEKADKVVSTREDSKGLNGNAVVQSKRRPRRECVRKTTVERVRSINCTT